MEKLRRNPRIANAPIARLADLRQTPLDGIPKVSAAITKIFPNRYENVSRESREGAFQFPYWGCPDIGFGGGSGASRTVLFHLLGNWRGEKGQDEWLLSFIHFFIFDFW